MKKYFSVDIYHNGHPVLLHDTLDEAKKACLHNTTEQYDCACGTDDIDTYESCVYEAIYGVVMGRCESIRRVANKEDSYESQYDYIVESPELVEYNGWISCEDQMPNTGEVILYYSICDNRIGIGLFDRLESEPVNDDGSKLVKYMVMREPYDERVFLACAEYWQPLPQPPILQQK